MSAKDNILKRLRRGAQPFTDVEAIQQRREVVSMDGVDRLTRFTEKATALSASVHQATDDEDALDYLLNVIDDDAQILAWDRDEIPLAGLDAVLNKRNITVADPHDGSVRVGVTGVEAALAATGSIIMSARAGRPRSVSLLPYVHVAILRESQILPHFEAWIAQQSADPAAFREVGNHVIITGASRTADIGMELVLGAHGPADLHLIVMADGQ